MANLDKSNIINGQTIEASHITDVYDALTGVTTYSNISLTGTSSYADNALSSSYAVTASYAANAAGVDTGSLLITSSISNDTITFTKGDTSTYNLIVNNVATSTSSSLAQTASYVETAQTASYVTTAQTASYVTTAQTASYVETAQTASYVTGSNVVGAVNNATNANSINGQTDPSGGVQAQSPLSLAVGSIRLSSGVGQSNRQPLLAGKSNGQDAFTTITAVAGTAGEGETYDAAIQPDGEIRVTDMGNGSSGATVVFTCWYLP